MIKQGLHLIIVCEDIHFFNWIASTVEVSSIKVKTIKQLHPDLILSINKSDKSDQLLIIEGKVYIEYFKEISDSSSSLDHQFPLLVVTDTYADSTTKRDAFVITDTIVKPSLSIHSLEHAILSLLKDYRLTQKLKLLAHYDALTGAANRYLFDDRMSEILKKAKRDKEPFSLLYFDLNGFKAVNDTHGHGVGDTLLKHFVKRLSKVKRETDTLARLGGDEFCMLIPNTTNESLLLLVDRIIAVLASPVSCSGVQLNIKTAIGGVNIKNQSVSLLTAQEILKVADKCVYKAKKSLKTHLVLETI
jgi:diguanylate cyclase (GGDEF)-like protein